jgi:Na+/H+ antiporter NhaD/arsenite permease-like protein
MPESTALPVWTMMPFPFLVLAIAALPMVVPKAWEHRWFQAVVILVVSLPIVLVLLSTGRSVELVHTGFEYAAFIATIGALYVTAGGVYATGDLEATPGVNVAFLILGSLLASAIGTTGASVLVIRPLLRTNSQRKHTAHLVPFFILAVANAGGLLTPLGDPPLLIGFIQGVPFFWTLRLLPAWGLYVGTFAVGLYIADRRAYALEGPEVRQRDRAEATPLEIKGAHNLGWLAAIIGAAFLPAGFREVAMVGIALASYFGTRRDVHVLNQFSFAPIVEVALLFAGLFVCLVPIESGLATNAEALPLRHGWQLFWVSGALSSLLDNAPTYAAFTALARGLSVGHDHLIAGIAPMKLAAVSCGSVVMGATTYIGNGPNLIMKSIAEKSGYALPSFVRFAFFAFIAMLPAHLVMTGVFAMLDR